MVDMRRERDTDDIGRKSTREEIRRLQERMAEVERQVEELRRKK